MTAESSGPERWAPGVPGEVAGAEGAFADLAGQEAVVTQLRRAAQAAARVLAGEAVTAGGMTHAWLFTGPPGSGRSVAARSFAAALLCPRGGCGYCAACRQVRAGTHADLMVVRPDGLSYGVKQTRDLVLRAAGAPSGGRWRVVLFEDADRCTEQAANALLKAIEEPAPRTVWLLCAPSAEDLVTTIRSRCRVVTLRVPSSEAVAGVLMSRDGIDPERALAAARAAQGHIGRARRLATDAEARSRREQVLAVPAHATSLGPALAAAAALVKTAEEEAKSVTGELDEPEREALRQAFGEGSTGKGVAKAIRGAAGALRDLEDRQKSRATRLKRDSLDRALLDLAAFYRDVLMIQARAEVELANADHEAELREMASASSPEATLHRIEAIMRCRERLAASVAPLLAVEEMTISLLAGLPRFPRPPRSAVGPASGSPD
jgi:DNA polymerase-3 subunit delta'